jgi:hypothetical protein
VQLEHLACEVFVQARDAGQVGRLREGGPAGAPLHDHRLGPRAELVVQVAQHRAMAHGVTQQALEGARDMRPDRLALEGASQPARRALGDRHREVVGPEHHEPLGKRACGGRSRGQVRAHVGLHEALEVLHQALIGAAGVGHRCRSVARGGRASEGHAALRLQEARVAAQAFTQRGELLAPGRICRPDLRQQPAMGV